METVREFGIQPTLLLAQIVNFLIILFLLKKFFYKPITKVLEERKKRIEGSLKNANLIEERLKKTEEKSAQILEEARNNAQSIIADAKKEAEKITNQATLEARLSVEQNLADAKIQIEMQRVEMKKQLEKDILSLVVDVVKKVLGRTLKQKERQDLTAKSLMEITKHM